MKRHKILCGCWDKERETKGKAVIAGVHGQNFVYYCSSCATQINIPFEVPKEMEVS